MLVAIATCHNGSIHLKDDNTPYKVESTQCDVNMLHSETNYSSILYLTS